MKATGKLYPGIVRGYTSRGGRIRTFANRKGCLVGGAAVLGLVLLYLLYLFAEISIPLVLGFLFPWDPPRAEGAPDEAVLRVLAPEEEEYRIEWGSGFWTATEEGEKVDPELGYRDYPLREEALDSNRHFQIKIYAGNKAAHPTGNAEVPLGAVLFVSGEYAECRGGRGAIYVSWTLGRKDLGSTTMRTACASYRYAPL